MSRSRVIAILLVLAAAEGVWAQSFSCETHGDATCTNLIPDANAGTPGVLTSRITVPAGVCEAAVGLKVSVRITHDYVGDLRLRLTSPGGSTRVLLDRSGLQTEPPGGCSSDDLAVTFDDAGAGATCPHTLPALSGALVPVEALQFAGVAGDWTLETTDFAHSGTGALESWSLEFGCASTCDDCVDDDADGQTDRADADCGAASSGGGAGLGTARAKAIAKCQKAFHKAGGALATRRLKRVQKCLGDMAACVQQKPGDAGCVGKATSRCNKELGALGGEGSRFAGAVSRACPDANDLLAAAGLGWSGKAAACAARGVPNLASAADVVACARATHECHVDGLVGQQVPRASDLLILAGHAPTELPCLGGPEPRTGDGLGDAGRGRALVKCQSAVQKAGAQLVTKKMKVLQGCAAKLNTCVQKNDTGCVSKVGGKCRGQVGKIAGLESKFRGAVVRACPDGLLADMLAPAGLGFEAPACGAGTSSTAEIAACLSRRTECRIDQVVEGQTPRLRELLGLAGATLP